MDKLLEDPQSLIFAILGGAVPAILWLWFWLHEEDAEHTDSRGQIALSFAIGGLMVMVAMWIQKFSLNFITDPTLQIILWATIEEVLKFIGVAVILLGTNIIKKSIDYPIYFIATALGFAALENIFYLFNLLNGSGTIVGILTGNLRYLGSTLLHATASSMMGSALGLSFFIRQYRFIYLFFGLLFAIVLHSVFNFFIMKGSGENFLSIFGFLWVVAIINILIFEKLKRMGDTMSAH